MAHSIPASYNVEDGIFMPPHRTLGFNSQITIDDALLLSEYIDEQQLTYEEAGKALYKDVANLRYELSSKGTVRFGELGTFSMNVTGNITFDPAPNGIDDPYNFGFEPILIPLLSECDKNDIVIKRRSIKKYVSVAVAAMLTFFIFSPVGDSAYEPSLKAGFTAGETMPVVKEAAKEVATTGLCEIEPVADTVTETIITKPQAAEPAVEIQAEVIEAPATEEPAKIDNGPTYSIIVASTPNEEKANLAIQELSAKMQAEYHVVKGGGRHRIAHSSYCNHNEANDALAQVKGTFPDAWVLTH